MVLTGSTVSRGLILREPDECGVAQTVGVDAVLALA